ncbi:hypothetical protein [Microbispora sp. CA-102843]|uniref:hypothetical protein n=1 Tax=Microbispora sp. CA-102843 TaxID=3239952 RepID=UPI003D8C801C
MSAVRTCVECGGRRPEQQAGVAALGGAAVADPRHRRELVPGDAGVVAGRLGDAS